MQEHELPMPSEEPLNDRFAIPVIRNRVLIYFGPVLGVTALLSSGTEARQTINRRHSAHRPNDYSSLPLR